MTVQIITDRKKDYLPLLLLGDERESDIDKYLERGKLFALYDGDLKSICVVTDEGDGVLEIQNLATDKRYQRQGYASHLLDNIFEYYKNQYDRIILGTGDAPGNLSFYRHRGFTITHREPDYFTTHFDYPIIEDGMVLRDRIYMEMDLHKKKASHYD